MHTYTYICIYIYIYVCVRERKWVYIYMCICVYVCVYICVYIKMWCVHRSISTCIEGAAPPLPPGLRRLQSWGNHVFEIGFV